MKVRYKDIIKTEQNIKDLGYAIENNIIEKVTVNTIAHFNNITSFEIYCKNVVPYSNYNNEGNLGYVIKAFIKLMELEKEDGVRLNEITNIPCRIICENGDGWGSKAIGIGHFMNDEFVLCDDLARVGIEVNDNE